ncbi:predicted protein [Chaetomium globosum CBS 148.51]|uniref:Uncharacterized protein n=1 Tax=Chaetomium globosum (strain ATCC 6205 / CBS 148.51 / DSM 1962 / NBRC 6347 / NRRL 1970) TaxID=306901 RepID=Q2HES8_CHAGB|nr:uncharacterized protein CHGG_01276 [Chaetomium globosum CBS 148.51]EAQ93041.1 predicted protein [Chaetomium globosum CBS 148.51]
MPPFGWSRMLLAVDFTIIVLSTSLAIMSSTVEWRKGSALLSGEEYGKGSGFESQFDRCFCSPLHDSPSAEGGSEFLPISNEVTKGEPAGQAGENWVQTPRRVEHTVQDPREVGR